MKLVSNLPLPSDTARAKYPFAQLTAVGQALVFPSSTDYAKVARAAHAYARRHDWFAVVRRLPNGDIAVWRARNV